MAVLWGFQRFADDCAIVHVRPEEHGDRGTCVFAFIRPGGGGVRSPLAWPPSAAQCCAPKFRAYARGGGGCEHTTDRDTPAVLQRLAGSGASIDGAVLSEYLCL